jgi:hypothetical protein
MEKNLKELFKKEKYDDVIKLIKEEYVLLFRRMLDFKNVKYSPDDDFEILSSKIPFSYPQYSDTILRLGNVLMDPDESYFGVLNSMLSIYESMDSEYKEESDYSEDMWDF